MSYISTEKGLERALEQTSRFYNDLEHIASDLGTLTKRYSQSHQSIDALDWDLNDNDIHSPKTIHRKQIRSNNKNKIRRKLNTNIDYNDNRLFDYSSSPLRRSRKKK
jgi:predicted patatin/cPLA2 family phospholipase